MNYKDFYLIESDSNGGLFNIKVGGDKAKLVDDDKSTRKIRVVSNTSENNGVESYIHNDNIGIKNCITIGTRGNDFFSCFQDDYTVTIVRALLLHTSKFELNRYIAFYICTLLRQNSYKYNYGRVLSGDRLKFEKIRLPVDNNGNPDWNWISNFSKKIYLSIIKSIKKDSVIKSNHYLSTKEWKTFFFEDIFDITKGKRLTKSEMNPGKTPYIGASDKNNGITNYIDKDPIFDDSLITVAYDGSIGETFWQQVPFWASDAVNVLKIKGVSNKYVAMFLIPLIKIHIFKFNYGRKWKLERMTKMDIRLPVDKEGNPDWEMMENYIKSLPYSAII